MALAVILLAIPILRAVRARGRRGEIAIEKETVATAID
jgi:hypothetical protein